MDVKTEEWVVSDEFQRECDKIFAKYDTDNKGVVSGSEVKEELKASNLQLDILAHIWDLCDVNKNGSLNHEEFALALWFIRKKTNEGVDPPSQLKPNMIPPSRRQAKHAPEGDEDDQFEDARDDDIEIPVSSKNEAKPTVTETIYMGKASTDPHEESNRIQPEDALGKWKIEEIDVGTISQVSSRYHTPLQSSALNSELEDGECTQSDGTEYYSNQSESKAEEASKKDNESQKEEQKNGPEVAQEIKPPATFNIEEVHELEEKITALQKSHQLDTLLEQIDHVMTLKKRTESQVNVLEFEISKIQMERKEQEKIIAEMEEKIKEKRAMLEILRITSDDIRNNHLAKQYQLLENMNYATQAALEWRMQAVQVTQEIRFKQEIINDNIIRAIRLAEEEEKKKRAGYTQE